MILLLIVANIDLMMLARIVLMIVAKIVLMIVANYIWGHTLPQQQRAMYSVPRKSENFLTLRRLQNHNMII